MHGRYVLSQYGSRASDPSRREIMMYVTLSSSGTSLTAQAAVKAINDVQSNITTVEKVRELRRAGQSCPIAEVQKLCRTIGYEPADLDALNPVHIAGTKGKGSTAAFVSSILAQYPGKVGLYTSPHLRTVRERIKIDNEPLSKDLFAKYLFEVWDKLNVKPGSVLTTQLNYFRCLTLIALHCYMCEGISTAVIECGIGGEEDTTNILVKPSVTAVTSLGIDHQAMLGNTIEQIAWHKAGIFKPGVPALTVPQPESALAIMRQRAAERDTSLQVIPVNPSLESIKLGLAGEVQQVNASLAVAIAAKHLDINIDILPPQFIRGLESTRLGGRFDQRADKHSSVTWFIDGGHTLESIERTGQWYAASPPSDINILVFNQQTRDALSLARRLHEVLASATSRRRPFSHVVFCSNKTYGRGFSAELVSMNVDANEVEALSVQHALAKSWKDVDAEADVSVVATIEQAIARARAIAGERSAKVLVTGSMHLVGGVIEVLESEVQ